MAAKIFISLSNAIIKSSCFQLYTKMLCQAELKKGCLSIPYERAKNLALRNNIPLTEFETFLRIDEMRYSGTDILFPSRANSGARFILLQKQTLEYLNDMYGVEEVKLYCHFAWLDSYQKALGKTNPFYYSSLNTLLNIKDSKSHLQKLTKDGLIEYDSMPKGLKNEKYLIKINLEPHEEVIEIGTIYLVAAYHEGYVPYVLECEYSPLAAEDLLAIK